MAKYTIRKNYLEEELEQKGINTMSIREFLSMADHDDPTLYVQSYCLYMSDTQRDAILSLNAKESLLFSIYWLSILREEGKGGIDEIDPERHYKLIQNTDIDFRVSCSSLELEKEGLVKIDKHINEPWDITITEKGKEVAENDNITSYLLSHIRKDDNDRLD